MAGKTTKTSGKTKPKAKITTIPKKSSKKGKTSSKYTSKKVEPKADDKAGWLTRASGKESYTPGVTSEKTNPLFNIKKYNNVMLVNNIMKEANKVSGTQDKMSLIRSQLALDSVGGNLWDDNSWTGGMMNRYVAEAMETANKKKDQTILDEFFNNVDGMTNKALTNSKLGLVFSGFDSRTLANKLLQGQDVVNIQNVDELNKHIMDFNKIDWKLIYSFGKENVKYFNDPATTTQEKWSRLKNLTRFGSTPNLVGSLLDGSSSTAEIANDYMKSVSMDEMPTPTFQNFCKDLLNQYKNGDLNAKRTIAMYEYYRANPNLMMVNSLDKLEKSATKLIDGFGDMAVDYAEQAARWANDKIEETYDKINDAYNKADETLKSFGLTLNPKWKGKLDEWHNKLGFGTGGKGKDAEVYLSASIKYSTMIEIDGIKLAEEVFEHYWELHDYVNTNMPTRELTLNMGLVELKQIDWTKKIHTIKMQRRYYFPHTQNAYKFSLSGNAGMKFYEEITNMTAKCTSRKEPFTKKEYEAMEASDKGGIEHRLKMVFLLTPLVMYEESTKGKVAFNEIPKDVNISTLITSAYANSIKQGQLMLTPPRNDFTLDKYILTPMTFPQLINKLQSDFDIYDGGPNIFMDGPMTYIMNKSGPNALDVKEGDWLYKFEIKPKNTLMDWMQTIIIPSMKTVKISLFDECILFPNDNSEFKPIASRWNKGSIFGPRNDSDKTALSLATTVRRVDHDYFLAEAAANIETYDFIIRIPTTFVCPIPPDNIELSYHGKTYIGTVKKWASEMHGQVRAVVLYCTAREGQSLTDDNTFVGKIRNKVQSLTGRINHEISERLGKIKDKYIPKANIEGRKDFKNVVQGKTLREAMYKQNKQVENFSHLDGKSDNKWINGSISSNLNKSNTSAGLPLVKNAYKKNPYPDLSQALAPNVRQNSANTINVSEAGRNKLNESKNNTSSSSGNSSGNDLVRDFEEKNKDLIKH